ncbi:MAG: TonB family protein [Gemmatimonadota bacterium]
MRQVLSLRSNRVQSAEFALLSGAMHIVLIGGAVLVTSRATGLPEQGRISPASFLIPLDRSPYKPRQLSPIERGELARAPGLGHRSSVLQEGKSALPVEPEREQRRGLGGDVGDFVLGPMVRGLDSVYSMLSVDEAVTRYDNSAAPVYPPDLLHEHIEGAVLAEFVVDTLGQVDSSSIHIISSSRPEFTVSVLNALSAMRFHPAMRSGLRVRQLVHQRFRFAIAPPEQA